ncbi:MAG: hypothetical protein HY043_06605 [Verrucomicrobia bacterium]|nr:hypothetical protein [Verrucomicrobiota bacterium]
MKQLIALALALLLLMPTDVLAAIGCTLSNPAQDLKYLFPDMTTYKEEARELDKMKNGPEFFKNLRARLGTDLDPVYETYETPYTVYSVFKGSSLIGVVHGVNVPGKGGVIQVFIAAGLENGEIKNFFFQRIESPAAKVLKNKEFRARFNGLTLADFYKHDYFAVAEPTSDKDKVGRIAAPDVGESGRQDYQASLRGIRKNLVLLDMFIYGLKDDPYYLRSQEALAKLKGKPKSE